MLSNYVCISSRKRSFLCLMVEGDAMTQWLRYCLVCDYNSLICESDVVITYPRKLHLLFASLVVQYLFEFRISVVMPFSLIFWWG